LKQHLLDLQTLSTEDVSQPIEQALTLGEPTFSSAHKPLSPKKVRSLRNVRIVIIGKNQTYRFAPLGVSEVADEDLEYVLSLKSRGGGCCGSNKIGGDAHFVMED
jgi:hypothetical protein